MTVVTTHVTHPVCTDALAQIRDRDTPNALFRQNLERIGTLLLAEATKNLPTVDGTVETPLTSAPATRIAMQPVVVPILRAGLGFVGAAQELLPNADIGFIGMARNEETHQPEPYVNKLPESLAGRPVIVVDPMLATGGSTIATIDLLKKSGAAKIVVVCIVTCREGLQLVEDAHPDVPIYTASIDDRLDENKYIVPGLGDAGDRLFGTTH
jgi:uracil phosphoribosyltransferase